MILTLSSLFFNNNWLSVYKVYSDGRKRSFGLIKKPHNSLNKLPDAEFDGFEGGLTTKKYTSMAKAVYATGTHYLLDLLEKKMLVKTAGDRSSKYAIKWDD
ncbi:hypothetical protein [Halodesulfovibrio sp. MK-HDV]|jgi:Fic family protein|uniref:hypothetical protein n=1 Tax=Halodesulfovibrio sp. MK-HDV TaxID=2599925 RepID=UPI001367CE0B|nr:hypothetical protein [Halodesulfovibrio sp. MK-HDV]KAF1077026.1 hypothetical protein MKHDV_00623 [Halodesulfovibrio sp. MK-HDV]